MARSTTQNLLEAAQALQPLVQDSYGAIDQARRLPQDVVRIMHEHSLFNLWLPEKFDGPELTLPDSLRVIEALAQLDGAVGWCSAVATTYSRLAAFTAPETAYEIFVADGGGSVAGAFAPTGQAVVEPGGYRVTGRWAYASGIQHSRWVIAGCHVIENEKKRLNADGTPEIRNVFVPRSKVEIIDTWDVSGLRGTGSHDYRIDGVFVPDNFSVVDQGVTSTCPGPFYRVPSFSTYSVTFAAVATGIARSALDRFVALATNKTPFGRSTALREDPVVQAAVGLAEGKLRAGRAFMYSMADEIWYRAEVDEQLTPHERALILLSGTGAVQAAKEVVQAIYDAAGATSVYEANGFARCLRDVNAVGQHIRVHGINHKLCGQVLLGLEPASSRF